MNVALVVRAAISFSQLESLLNDPNKRQLLLFAAAVMGLAVTLAVLRLLMQWLRRPSPPPQADQSFLIDLASLPIAEPGKTQLMVYHVPVRLAVVVIAPLGRDSHAPRHSEVRDLLDHLVPGLAAVMTNDQTLVRIWPQQLSATGFAPTLLRHAPLPSDRGRGTPWCMLAGRTLFGGASFAVGLALAATAPTNLGLINVQSDHQWLEILRMRTN
jgi:hypothetical protein